MLASSEIVSEYTDGASDSTKITFISLSLINSITLAEMEGTMPVETTGQVRWYKRPTPGHTYMVSLDPAMGTGGDYAAIQVFELPTFDQVGE